MFQLRGFKIASSKEAPLPFNKRSEVQDQLRTAKRIIRNPLPTPPLIYTLNISLNLRLSPCVCLCPHISHSATDLTSIVSSNRQSGLHVPVQPPASQYFSIDPGMDASSMMSSLGSSSRHSGQHQFQDTFPGRHHL